MDRTAGRKSAGSKLKVVVTFILYLGTSSMLVPFLFGSLFVLIVHCKMQALNLKHLIFN